MFRVLLAHPQERLHKRHLVYCVSTPILVQLAGITRNIPSAVCVSPPEDEQGILETYRGPKFSINLTKIASRWFHYTDILWCTVSKTLRIQTFPPTIRHFVFHRIRHPTAESYKLNHCHCKNLIPHTLRLVSSALLSTVSSLWRIIQFCILF
jgi:hypothetical protein